MVVLLMAGVRGIEPRSRVLETLILAVVLYPSTVLRQAYGFSIASRGVILLSYLME